MSITLNELQVYKLRVSLIAFKWGERQSNFDSKHGWVQAGSDVYLDQVTDGLAAFHLFGEDCKGLYVRFPVEYTDDYLEIVLDETGQPETIKDKA